MSDLRRAAALMGSKQHAVALPLLQSALRRSEQKPGGASSAETAEILDNIGWCYFAQRNFRAAAEHFQRAVAISKYAFSCRLGASCDAGTALYNLDAIADAEAQHTISLSVIAAEAAAGTTAPALLKGHRAEVLFLSATNLTSADRFYEALYEEIVAYYESIGDTENLTRSLTSLGRIYYYTLSKDSPKRRLQWRVVCSL